MSEWQDAFDEACGMPHGRARMRALREALDRADAVNEVDGGFRIRLAIIETAYYSGDPVPALAAFAWCRARMDEEPERFADHTYTVGWRHKWMPVWAMEFPNVGAARLEAMIDDLERRHVADGAGRRQALMVRLALRRDTGLGRPLPELLGDWRASARSSLSDCPACEQLSEAQTLLALGDPAGALTVLRPLLTGRASFCADGPEAVLALAVPLLVEAGDHEGAASAFRKGIRSSRGDARKLPSVASLLASAARAGERTRLAALLPSTIGLLDEAPSPHDLMVSAAAISRALRALDPDVEVVAPAALPRFLGGQVPSDAARAGVLADALEAHACSLAGAFDRRNESEVASAAVEAILAAADLEPTSLFRVDTDRTLAPAGQGSGGAVAPDAPLRRAVDEVPPQSAAAVPTAGLAPAEAIERCRTLLVQAAQEADPTAPSSLALVREAIDIVRDHGPTEALADARRLMGRLLAVAGRLDEAAVQFAEAAGLYEAIGDPPAACGVLLHRAQIELLLDEPERAQDLATDALLQLGVAEPAGIEDLGLRRRALGVLADLAALDWRDRDAATLLRQCIELDEEAGDPTVEARVRLSRLLVRDDDPTAALEAIDRAEAELVVAAGIEPSERARLEAEIALRRADALWEAQRHDEALAAARVAVEVAVTSGVGSQPSEALQLLASVHWDAWVSTWRPDDADTWDDEAEEMVGGAPFVERGDAEVLAAALATNQEVLDRIDALDGASIEDWDRRAIEWRLEQGRGSGPPGDEA